jgi:hypothetical protein
MMPVNVSSFCRLAFCLRASARAFFDPGFGLDPGLVVDIGFELERPAEQCHLELSPF